MECCHMYCCICGCPLNLVDLRNPDNPDPDEDELYHYMNPYDKRFLSYDQIKWLADLRMMGPICKSLSERLASTGDPSLTSAFCFKGVFISGPAECEEETRYRKSRITSADGSTDLIPVWKLGMEDADMFFPIHTYCITFMERQCYFRSAQFPQTQDSKSVPAHLEEFCSALNRRRERNLHPTPQQLRNSSYLDYGSNGGLEWDHGYYGATQSWRDGWENQAHGGWICADPINVPNLSSYIISQIPKPSDLTNTTSTTVTDMLESVKMFSLADNQICLSNMPTELLSEFCTHLPFLSVIALRKTCKVIRARVISSLTQRFWRTRLQAGEVLPWLLPGEFDGEEASASSNCDWEKGLKALIAMARDIGPHESRYEEVTLPGARPIGLENRWRIWKILKGIGSDGEEL